MTIPNVLSTIAVLLAASGTAYAAVVVTGAQVKDESLVSADFRNGSLGTADFSASTARTAGKAGDAGAKGATGPDGDQGPEGSQGSAGAAGDQGVSAPRAYTFQKSARHQRVSDHEANPATPIDPTDCSVSDPQVNCPGSAITTIDGGLRFPRWSYLCQWAGEGVNRHCNTTGTSAVRLSRSRYPVMVTSENPSGGLLVLHQPGTIVLNASATFYTQRSAIVQQRLECQLQVALVQNGVPQSPIDVGVPATVYRQITPDPAARNERERLLTISVTGAVDEPPGTYESQLSCNAPDDTGIDEDRLEFIEGNLSVLSTRRNGQA